MAAARNSLWFDPDNEPLERGMWFDTGLGGKRFQGSLFRLFAVY
jgi:hypothetical protein